MASTAKKITPSFSPQFDLRDYNPIETSQFVLPETYESYNPDTLIKNNYKRLLRLTTTQNLLEDLRNFLILRELGMKEYRYFVAEFRKEQKEGSTDIESRIWLQLTLLKNLAKEKGDVKLIKDSVTGNFKFTVFDKDFNIIVKHPAHKKDEFKAKYPVIIFESSNR